MSDQNVDAPAQNHTEPGTDDKTPAVELTPDEQKEKLATKMFDADGKPSEGKNKAEEVDAAKDKAGEADDKPGDTPEDGEKDGDTDPDKKGDEDKEGDGDKEEDVEINLPEGSHLQKADADEIAKLAKEQGLKGKDAQKYVDVASKALENFQKKQVESLELKNDEWTAATKIDKEIGGDNYNMSIKLANDAYKKFATELFKEELVNTKFGSHPEMVRVFSRIGKEMADGNFHSGPKPPTEPTPMHQKFYGSSDKTT